MRVPAKIAIAFLVVAVASVGATGLLSFYAAEQTLERQVVAELTAVADLQEARVTATLDQYLERVTLLSSRTALRTNLDEFNKNGTESARTAISRILADAVAGTPSLKRVDVLDTAGTVVASTVLGKQGEDASAAPGFEAGKLAPNFSDLLHAPGGELRAALSAPLLLDGRLVGVLLVESGVEELLAITSTYAGLGETGETLLAKPSGGAAVYITPLRFDPGAALALVVTPDSPALAGVRGDERAFSAAPDYRGETVLAVSRSVADAGWGLAVKIDRAEALAPVAQLRDLFLSLMVLVGVLVAIGGVLYAGRMMHPVEQLAAVARRFAAGDLAARTQMEARNDEFGMLARAMDDMASSLQRSADLERVLNALRVQTENYETLLKAASDLGEGIVITDGRRFVYVNDAATHILGRSREELLSLPSFLDIVATDQRQTVAHRARERVGGVTTEDHYESAVLAKDGRRIDVEVAARALPVGEARGTIAILRDITDRKRAQQERERLVGELKRSNEDLEQFAYVASHDLQEPLRMVASYVQLLERRYKGKLDADADEFIHYATDGAQRMQRLISDLLEYSRIGRKGAPFRAVAPDHALDIALQNLSAAIQESSAKVTRDGLPRVTGDEGQLTQLFQNLVGNAVKFRRGEPRVHIGAQPGAREHLFFVRDNGIGIAPEYQERIFQLFQRLHTRDQYPGTGVGLALSRKIVEKHGGRIWVESVPGEGSTFYLTLPAAEPVLPGMPPVAKEAETIAKRATELV